MPVINSNFVVEIASYYTRNGKESKTNIQACEQTSKQSRTQEQQIAQETNILARYNSVFPTSLGLGIAVLW